MSCCLKIGHRGIQKGGNRFDQAEQDNRLFEKVFRKSLSECCHRDRTGRMESGCVRVSILRTTIDGLLRLPSPCWLEELQSAGHVSVFLSPLPLWLISYIVTYDDKNMRNYWHAETNIRFPKHWLSCTPTHTRQQTVLIAHYCELSLSCGVKKLFLTKRR